MAILGGNFNMNLGKLQPQAPLCAIRGEQSYIHELKGLLQQRSWSNSLGSTIYQWGLIALSKCPMEGWIFGAQGKKMRHPPPPPVTPKLKVRELSQSGF